MNAIQKTTQPIRVAVLGAGEWARQFHLPSLKALENETPVEIAGIWNQNGDSAELAARQFGIARVFRSFEEILDEQALDCFVVIVNSRAVTEILTRLLPRGLPVFTEKPPGKSYREACHLAERVKVPNVIAFNRRYMPINRRFKELADNLKDAYFAECHFYRNERNPEHFVTETGIHGINFMEHLFGPIQRARTEVHASHANGTRFWISTVTFESGLQGLFKFFPACGSSVERYEVHGPKTSLYLHCPQTYTSDHPGRIEIHENGTLASTLYGEENDLLLGAGLLDEYRDFFEAVRTGSATTSNFRNACNTMRVAEAIEAAVDLV